MKFVDKVPEKYSAAEIFVEETATTVSEAIELFEASKSANNTQLQSYLEKIPKKDLESKILGINARQMSQRSKFEISKFLLEDKRFAAFKKFYTK